MAAHYSTEENLDPIEIVKKLTLVYSEWISNFPLPSINESDASASENSERRQKLHELYEDGCLLKDVMSIEDYAPYFREEILQIKSNIKELRKRLPKVDDYAF